MSAHTQRIESILSKLNFGNISSDEAVEQLEQLLGEAIDDVLSKDLNWLIDTESGFTIHFLPEHVKDRLKQEAKEK